MFLTMSKVDNGAVDITEIAGVEKNDYRFSLKEGASSFLSCFRLSFELKVCQFKSEHALLLEPPVQLKVDCLKQVAVGCCW